MSLPLRPSSPSLPSSPLIVSLPPPPRIISFPAPPLITASTTIALNTRMLSSPSPPLIVILSISLAGNVNVPGAKPVTKILSPSGRTTIPSSPSLPVIISSPSIRTTFVSETISCNVTVTVSDVVRPPESVTSTVSVNTGFTSNSRAAGSFTVMSPVAVSMTNALSVFPPLIAKLKTSPESGSLAITV